VLEDIFPGGEVWWVIALFLETNKPCYESDDDNTDSLSLSLSRRSEDINVKEKEEKDDSLSLEQVLAHSLIHSFTRAASFFLDEKRTFFFVPSFLLLCPNALYI
jgi:hypothetical protein